MEQQAVEVRMGQTHLGFVDAAKGLGMLAIIWGHMDYLWSTSSVWFSSFKIAVFYVVVGLLKAYRYGERGQRDSCAQVMKKRWYSLVIPYGVFSALAILAHLAFLTIHGGSRLAALKGDVILTVTLRGVATLWFLPTLLIAELLFAAVRPEGWSAAKRILVCVLAPAILCVVGYFYQEMDIPGADRRGCRWCAICLLFWPRASAAFGSCCAGICFTGGGSRSGWEGCRCWRSCWR